MQRIVIGIKGTRQCPIDKSIPNLSQKENVGFAMAITEDHIDHCGMGHTVTMLPDQELDDWTYIKHILSLYLR